MDNKKIRYIDAYDRPKSEFWSEMDVNEQNELLFQKKHKLFKCSECDTMMVVSGIGSLKVRVYFRANTKHDPICVRYTKKNKVRSVVTNIYSKKEQESMNRALLSVMPHSALEELVETKKKSKKASQPIKSRSIEDSSSNKVRTARFRRWSKIENAIINQKYKYSGVLRFREWFVEDWSIFYINFKEQDFSIAIYPSAEKTYRYIKNNFAELNEKEVGLAFFYAGHTFQSNGSKLQKITVDDNLQLIRGGHPEDAAYFKGESLLSES